MANVQDVLSLSTKIFAAEKALADMNPEGVEAEIKRRGAQIDTLEKTLKECRSELEDFRSKLPRIKAQRQVIADLHAVLQKHITPPPAPPVVVAPAPKPVVQAPDPKPAMWPPPIVVVPFPAYITPRALTLRLVDDLAASSTGKIHLPVNAHQYREMNLPWVDEGHRTVRSAGETLVRRGIAQHLKGSCYHLIAPSGDEMTRTLDLILQSKFSLSTTHNYGERAVQQWVLWALAKDPDQPIKFDGETWQVHLGGHFLNRIANMLVDHGQPVREVEFDDFVHDHLLTSETGFLRAYMNHAFTSGSRGRRVNPLVTFLGTQRSRSTIWSRNNGENKHVIRDTGCGIQMVPVQASPVVIPAPKAEEPVQEAVLEQPAPPLH